jgi:hypothetical protein
MYTLNYQEISALVAMYERLVQQGTTLTAIESNILLTLKLKKQAEDRETKEFISDFFSGIM